MLAAFVAPGASIYIDAPRAAQHSDAPAPPQSRRRGPAPPAMLVNSAMLDRGREVYQASCASCHGPGGSGDVSPKSTALPRTKDQTAVTLTDRLTDMDIANVVQYGAGAMSRVQGVRGDALVAVVTFVRSLSRSPVRIVEVQALAQDALKNYSPVSRDTLAQPPPHTGRLSYDEAVQLESERIGFVRYGGQINIDGITAGGSDTAAPTLGYFELMLLREDYFKKMRELDQKGSLRDFHDRVYKIGFLSVTLIREVLMHQLEQEFRKNTTSNSR